jgi:HTH-type transcriptional regulator/antitoxin HigA
MRNTTRLTCMNSEVKGIEMLNLKDFRTLRSEEEYKAALAEVRPYFENEPDEGSDAAAHFDALVLLIEQYEAKLYPIAAATPIEVIKSVMAANNYTRADLIAVIGSKARAADLLNGKREINLDQIRKLSREWNIPAGSLIGEISA